MRRPQARLRILKKTPRPSGRDRAGQGHTARRYRYRVRRRSQDRAEQQNHPSLGKARHPPVGAARPAHGLDLHLRCDLAPQDDGVRPPPASARRAASRGSSTTIVCRSASRSMMSTAPSITSASLTVCPRHAIKRGRGSTQPRRGLVKRNRCSFPRLTRREALDTVNRLGFRLVDLQRISVRSARRR